MDYWVDGLMGRTLVPQWAQLFRRGGRERTLRGIILMPLGVIWGAVLEAMGALWHPFGVPGGPWGCHGGHWECLGEARRGFLGARGRFWRHFGGLRGSFLKIFC